MKNKTKKKTDNRKETEHSNANGRPDNSDLDRLPVTASGHVHNSRDPLSVCVALTDRSSGYSPPDCDCKACIIHRWAKTGTRASLRSIMSTYRVDLNGRWLIPLLCRATVGTAD